MRDALPEIRAAGAELVVVGSGTPEQAARFRDERGLDFPLFVDPELEAYRAAGLRRSVIDTLGPRALAHAMRAFRRGARQGSVQGDPWQLGGAFVIDRTGKPVYRHVSRNAGDHAPIGGLLGALRACTPGTG